MNIIEYFKRKKKLSKEEWLKLPIAKTTIIRPNGKWPIVVSEHIQQVVTN